MKYCEIEEIDLEVIIDMFTITIQKILGKFYFEFYFSTNQKWAFWI